MLYARALQLGVPHDQITAGERAANFVVHTHLTAHTNIYGVCKMLMASLSQTVHIKHCLNAMMLVLVTDCPHQTLLECNDVGSCHRPFTSNTA